MKKGHILIATLMSVSALWGCKSEGQGVFEGVIWSDDSVPQAAQVIVQMGEAPQLTLWDEREHQVSYRGVLKNTQLLFAQASVTCEVSGSDLSCENSNGSSLLMPADSESADIASFSGTYQARFSDELYQMTIDQSGALKITGEKCESEGALLTTIGNESVVNLELDNAKCLKAGSVNIATLEVDNDSLVSINVQTDSDHFPQVWVQI